MIHNLQWNETNSDLS